MASRLTSRVIARVFSPTLILGTPADFQLIVFPPHGVKVRFACSFNPQQYGGVRIEEAKRRRARRDLYRSSTIYLDAAGDAGQDDFNGEAHGTNLDKRYERRL
jgi:hypothetical protein